ICEATTLTASMYKKTGTLGLGQNGALTMNWSGFAHEGDITLVGKWHVVPPNAVFGQTGCSLDVAYGALPALSPTLGATSVVRFVVKGTVLNIPVQVEVDAQQAPVIY